MSNNFFQAVKNFKQPGKKRYFLAYAEDGSCKNITTINTTDSNTEIDLQTNIEIDLQTAVKLGCVLHEYYIKDRKIEKKPKVSTKTIYPQWREQENGYLCQDNNMFWPKELITSGGKGFVYDQD